MLTVSDRYYLSHGSQRASLVDLADTSLYRWVDPELVGTISFYDSRDKVEDTRV